MTYAHRDINLAGLKNEPEKRILRPHIRVGCNIYPQKNSPVFPDRSTKERVLNWDKEKTEGTVTSLNWSKRIGEAAGNWTATVKLGRNASIDPIAGDVLDGDWVDLQVLRNGYVFPLCRGVVDTVSEAGSSAGGARVATISLVGRDHGALFMTPLAWNNIFVQSLKELATGIGAVKIKGGPGGTPSEMFERLINATFAAKTTKTQAAWSLPPSLKSENGSKRFGDELQIINDTDTRGRLDNEMQLWTKAGQNLHETLSQWCNPLLNEYWFDTPNNETALDLNSWRRMQATIRERPFVNTTDGHASPWFGLRELRVPSWLIDTDTLARSGRERFTIFQITADFSYGNTQEQAAIGAPLWSPDDVELYGVRPYMENTRFIEHLNWAEKKDTWQRLVVDWFAPNPYWLSGTMEFPIMLPEARVGSRLRVETGGRDLTAYIEGVEHSFEFSEKAPRSRTKLMLTRGFMGTDDQLLKMVQTVSSRFTAGFKMNEHVPDSLPSIGGTATREAY